MRPTEKALMDALQGNKSSYVDMFLALLGDIKVVTLIAEGGKVDQTELVKAAKMWYACIKTILIKQYTEVAVANMNSIVGSDASPEVMIKLAEEYLDTGKIQVPGFDEEGNLK